MHIRLTQMRKKFSFNIFVFSTIFILLCIPGPLPVSAENQTITAIGEYTAGEGETALVAKERALVQAMRFAAEQAGVYVESYSRTNNLVLTKDEVSVLARGVVEVVNKQYDEPRYSGGFYFRVTITAKVNTDNIESLRLSLKDKSTVDDLNRLQAAYDESQREIETLKQQISQTTGDEKKNIEQSIAQNEKKFTATQWFERGYDLQVKQKDYSAAIQAYTEAIAIDLQNAAAYYNRGLAYSDLEQYEQAIGDYAQAIALDPTDEAAYYGRGNAYNNLKQYKQAISDYDRAIALDPKDASAYNNRGLVYANLKQYERAIIDYDQAIALDPKDVDEYYNRGLAYSDLEQYERAIVDYNKAITLDPQYADAYYGKGFALYSLNRSQEAIAVLRKYIQYSRDNYFIDQAKDMIRDLGGMA